VDHPLAGMIFLLLPTDVLACEIFSHLSSGDLARLEVAVTDQCSRHHLMDVYPALHHLQPSPGGLDVLQMTWFFKRRIPLSSITFSCRCTANNVTVILNMLYDSTYATAVKSMTLSCDLIQSMHVSQILTMCTKLESIYHLKAYGDSELNDALMTQLSMRCPGLTSLTVDQFGPRSTFSDTSFRALSKGCPSLTYLDLSTTNTSEAALIALAEGCPDLTTVLLEEATRIREAGFISLARCCHSLTTLNFIDCNVTSAVIVALAHGCPLLSNLRVWNSDGDLDNSVVLLAQKCPMLTYLQLVSCDLTDAAVCALARGCRMLTELDVSFSGVTDASVEALMEYCPMLTNLGLMCTEVTDTSVLAIANGGLSNLNCLDVEDMSEDDIPYIITDEALEELRNKRPDVFLSAFSFNSKHEADSLFTA
jgi:hypothetical protein